MPEWQPIHRAPLEADVRVQARDPLGTYVLSFPCRLTDEGWINSRTGARLAVTPVCWKAYESPNSEHRRRPQSH